MPFKQIIHKITCTHQALSASSVTASMFTFVYKKDGYFAVPVSRVDPQPLRFNTVFILPVSYCVLFNQREINDRYFIFKLDFYTAVLQAAVRSPAQDRFHSRP